MSYSRINIQSSSSARFQTIAWTERKTDLYKQNADRLAKELFRWRRHTCTSQLTNRAGSTKTKPKTWLLQKTNFGCGRAIADARNATEKLRPPCHASYRSWSLSKAKRLLMRHTVCVGQLSATTTDKVTAVDEAVAKLSAVLGWPWIQYLLSGSSL